MLIPFMVRQAHHERNRQASNELNKRGAVRLEPVEGLNKGFLNKNLWDSIKK